MPAIASVSVPTPSTQTADSATLQGSQVSTTVAWHDSSTGQSWSRPTGVNPPPGPASPYGNPYHHWRPDGPPHHGLPSGKGTTDLLIEEMSKTIRLLKHWVSDDATSTIGLRDAVPSTKNMALLTAYEAGQGSRVAYPKNCHASVMDAASCVFNDLENVEKALHEGSNEGIMKLLKRLEMHLRTLDRFLGHGHHQDHTTGWTGQTSTPVTVGGSTAMPSSSLTDGASITPSSSLTDEASITPSSSWTDGASVTPSSSLTDDASATPSSSWTDGASVTPSSSLTGEASITPSSSLTDGPSGSPSSTPANAGDTSITPSVTTDAASSTPVEPGASVTPAVPGEPDPSIAVSPGAPTDSGNSSPAASTQGSIHTSLDTSGSMGSIPMATGTSTDMSTTVQPANTGVPAPSETGDSSLTAASSTGGINTPADTSLPVLATPRVTKW